MENEVLNIIEEVLRDSIRNHAEAIKRELDDDRTVEEISTLLIGRVGTRLMGQHFDNAK